MKRNPHEVLIEEMADIYVELVMEATEELAPHGPWWHAELSSEQQLWRYLDIREDIIPWLVDVSDYFPEWRSVDDMLKGIEELATTRIEDRVPGELLVDERADALKEIVQAVGPKEAARHIRRMETLALKREQGQALIQPAPVDLVPPAPAPPDGTGSVFVPAVIGGQGF